VLLFISGAACLVLAMLAFRHFSWGDDATAVYLLAIWIGVGSSSVAWPPVSRYQRPAAPGRGWSIFVGVTSLLAD